MHYHLLTVNHICVNNVCERAAQFVISELYNIGPENIVVSAEILTPLLYKISATLKHCFFSSQNELYHQVCLCVTRFQTFSKLVQSMALSGTIRAFDTPAHLAASTNIAFGGPQQHTTGLTP